jgi:hypothetical protein
MADIDQLFLTQTMQGQGTGGQTAASHHPFSNAAGIWSGGPEGIYKGQLAEGLESLKDNSRLGKAPGLKVVLDMDKIMSSQAQALTPPTGQFAQSITPPPTPISNAITGKVASVFASRKK